MAYLRGPKTIGFPRTFEVDGRWPRLAVRELPASWSRRLSRDHPATAGPPVVTRSRQPQADELPVLALIAEQGAVTLAQLGRFLGLGPKPTIELVERLWNADFLRCEKILVDQPAWVWLSRRGARLSGSELAVFRPVVGGLPAVGALNEIRLQVEPGAGEGRWIAGRRLRREGGRGSSVPRAVLETGAERHAIELRLGKGEPDRLDHLVRRRSSEYDAVVCFCAPSARGQLERLASKRDWPRLVIRDVPEGPKVSKRWSAAEIRRPHREPRRRARPRYLRPARPDTPPPWSQEATPPPPPRSYENAREADLPRPKGERRSGPRDETEVRQRRHLIAATVELASRHGFDRLPIGKVVDLAGVSKTTFYRFFDDKHACFLAAVGESAVPLGRRLDAAYRARPDWVAGLRATIQELAGILASDPSAPLVFVEALALGADGRARVEAGLGPFLVRLRGDLAATGVVLTAFEADALLAGWIGVASRALRHGDDLAEHVEELLAWSRSCIGVSAAPVPTAPSANVELGPRLAIGWEEPPAEATVRRSLGQRQRILQAAVQLVVEDGFEVLSIPRISARAGTSNKTWYEHFDTKEEALLVAFDQLAGAALDAFAKAFDAAGDHARAVAAGIDALFRHLADQPILAALAVELPSLGPPGLQRLDLAAEAFARYFRPPGSQGEIPTVAHQATYAAITSAICRPPADEGPGSLPSLAPRLTALALAPLGAGGDG